VIVNLLNRLRNKTLREYNPGEQEYLPLTDDERSWIAVHLESAKKLAHVYALGYQGKPLYPDVLDRIYTGWWNSPQRSETPANDMINMIGLAFGQFFVDYRGLEWIAVKDNHGTDIAVHGNPGDTLIFPTNFVAKRYERQETDFLAASERELSLIIHKFRHGKFDAHSR
jgi:hypothetical protein